MQTQWIKQNICYDGTQLKPHWIYQQSDLLGDALVAWVGPAQVDLEHMVDVEDVKAASPIASPKMLHFLGEFFGFPLMNGVVLQRLFILMLQDHLTQHGVSALLREGDDLYWQQEGQKKKLSVSIVTASSISSLMHIGVNVETAGTPVPTVGLKDWDINPETFAKELLCQFQKELLDMQRATWKVRPVS